MRITATITNDQITPDIMAHMDIRYYDDTHDNEYREWRQTTITLHDMVKDHVKRLEHALNTVEVVDNG